MPATTLTTRELIGRTPNLRGVDVERITGVAERRTYDPRPETGEDSFGMALSAARECLAASRYEAADLDIVISASITRFKDADRFYFEPSFAGSLARDLGARSALHFDVSNACAGMMTGVYVLDRMIRSGAVRNGMVVSGEQATRVAETAAREIGDSYDPQFASLSVGDSAAAVVMDRSADEADRIHYVDLMTCAEYSHLCMGMPSDRTGESRSTRTTRRCTTRTGSPFGPDSTVICCPRTAGISRPRNSTTSFSTRSAPDSSTT